MEYSYVESSVERKRTKMDIWYKVLIATGFFYFDVFIFWKIGWCTGLLAFAFSIFFTILIYSRMFNVEYEYIFCDGQIDFDIIRGAQKRKHMLRVETENAEFIGPADSDKVKSYNVDTVLNYYSKGYDAKPYAFIVRKNDKLMKIIIEPNAKFLRSLKYRMPRKYELYAEDKIEIENLENSVVSE